MISKPPILLINCVGSYFYSILEHLNSEGEINGTLFYFGQSLLIYNELLIEDVKLKYCDNPWGYQPIKIENLAGECLEIDDSFFQFLCDRYYLKMEKYDIEKYSLTDILKMVDNEVSFLICTVDEFYLKESRFYKKKHNKHFLLIKSIDYKNEIIEIVDSEVNFLYSISFEEIEIAIRNSIYKRKKVYLVDGEKYKSNYSLQMYDKYKMSFEKLNSDFITDMINDIKNKKNPNDFDFSYYYKGYYYNIISKISPYCQIYLQMNGTDIICRKKLKIIIKEWKNLSKIMYLRLYRNNLDVDGLILKLDAIQENYNEYNAYLEERGRHL